MSEKIDLSKGFSRRTMVKGAAWSVPVLATAVAAPAFAATTANYDVGVTSSCVGNYKLGVLDLVEAIPLAGPVVANTVKGLLGLVGLTPVQSRGFTISAVEGTIPAGTQFTLTSGGGIIDLTPLGLGQLLGAGVLGLVTTNGNTAVLKLNSDISQGNSTSITLPVSAIDVGLTGNSELTLQGVDNPSGAGASNSASLNLVSIDTNLAAIIDMSRVPWVVRTLVGAVKITVQLCPGQSDPR